MPSLLLKGQGQYDAEDAGPKKGHRQEPAPCFAHSADGDRSHGVLDQNKSETFEQNGVQYD
jgi:hypothetical protein